MSEIPITVGSAGLTGRQQIVRVPEAPDEPDGYDENGEPVWAVPRATGKAMPSNCRRVVSSPSARDGCAAGCEGVQRNGGCLLDVVRAAEAHGVDWTFEIDPHEGFWDYAGPPIPGLEMVKVGVGASEGRWSPGSEPSDPYLIETPPPPEFDCPYCGLRVVQDIASFHFWCPGCGKNAKDE